MNKTALTKFAPHIAAILLFICISFMYFTPVLEGKQLLGHDSESWMCMAKETMDYNTTHDEVTLWTNSMFGGMPTYQISMNQPYNAIKYVEDVIHFFPNTIYNLLLYLIGCYILLLVYSGLTLFFAGVLLTFPFWNAVVYVLYQHLLSGDEDKTR